MLSKLIFILLIVAATASANTNSVYQTEEQKSTTIKQHQHFEPQVTTICGSNQGDNSNSGGNSAATGKIINTYLNQQNGIYELDPLLKTCLNSKIEILKYCQRIYPNLDINNIVESTHTIIINTCEESKNGQCIGNIEKKSVFTWRCLESPFQSEALLVPSPCIFDHIHNKSKCQSLNEWMEISKENCLQKKNMYLKSYAVLLPCGISLFTGVEFVCCPISMDTSESSHQLTTNQQQMSNQGNLASNKKINKKYKTEYDNYEDETNGNGDEDDDEDDEDEDDEDDYEDEEKTTKKIIQTTTIKPTIDPYYQNFNINNEHNAYIEAKERLNKLHKSRINNIMLDWNKLEERYQAMRLNDPNGAEEFKKSVTMRFQKTVKSLEEESLAEKKQLISIHGQRILSHLNEKKREAMECFTKSLNERPQISRKIRKCIEKLMKYLNKDRHHTIIYFKNNLNQNEDIYEYTLDRLEQIGNTCKESMDMLGRYPHLQKELKPLIEDYILSLQGLSDLKFNSILTSTRDSDSILLNSLKLNVVDQLTSTTTTIGTTEKYIDEMQSISSTIGSNAGSNIGSNIGKTGSNTAENIENENNETKLYNKIDHEYNSNIKINNLEQHRESTFTVRREIYYSNDKSVYIIMAFAGFALFGTIVIGILILRKRNSPRNQGFLEVNTTGSNLPESCSGGGGGGLKSPEEKHVVNMQINGYENPTYKYFEISK